jgi:hypothetical protein
MGRHYYRRKNRQRVDRILQIAQMPNGNVCQSIPLVSWDEGVFVVIYFRLAGFVEDNRNNIEAEGAVCYIVGCEKIAGSEK